MKLRDIMSKQVVHIHPEEPVEVAARTLAHYNIGALPVCSGDGRLCGMITDRDIVIRCIAAGKSTAQTKVAEVMSARLVTADSDMDASAAASLMGKQKVRRLPVVQQGRLCGMVSLADLAAFEDGQMDAAEALGEICSNLTTF